MNLDPYTLILGSTALVLAYLAGWARGRARRGQGGVEPTWYPPVPPLPGRGYQPRPGAPGRPTRALRDTGARLPVDTPRNT